MLNEDKLQIMTYLAKYENNPRLEKSILAARTYRSDYLVKNGIWSFIMGTIVFAVMFGIYAMLNLEFVTMAVFTDGFMRFFNTIMVRYGVFITIYVGISIIVYNIKYTEYYDDFMRYRRLQKELLNLKMEDIQDE